jgi:His-Xaa-Ser system radical SAM maturase HxsC
MLRLETHARITGLQHPLVLKVQSISDLDSGTYTRSDCAVLLPDAVSDSVSAERLNDCGAILSRESLESLPSHLPVVSAIRDPDVIAVGDVIRLSPGSSHIRVLYRRGATSNVLFITERCNSKCLMCSQPPRDEDDSWRVAELFKLIPLIDSSEASLAITGGEPTLLGSRLADVIEYCAELLPETSLHILSNGRALKERSLVREVLRPAHKKLSWGIPLYSDAPEDHDYVVQAKGAFIETVTGLLNLAEHGACVEIRVVLQRVSVQRLRELMRFIFENMPFVDHVALMGVEPIGFAPTNHDVLWSDPTDFAPQLEASVHYLADRGINVSLYNLPLCVVPRSLWPHYRRSISDWKNVHIDECRKCAARELCGGFFGSVKRAWIPKGVHTMSQGELAHGKGEEISDEIVA